MRNLICICPEFYSFQPSKSMSENSIISISNQKNTQYKLLSKVTYTAFRPYQNSFNTILFLIILE